MKLFCLLVVVGLAAGEETSHSGYGLTIDRIRERTKSLEDDLKTVAGTVSDISTLCAVGHENLNEINDFDIPRLNTENKQQYELIASYQGQVKALQHKVDAAKALEKEALSLADSTADNLDDVIDDYLNGSEVAGENVLQDLIISNLKSELVTCKREFLANLTSAINDLNQQEADTRVLISDLEGDVASKKCEYGSGIFPVNQETMVTFKTQFDTAPNVSFSLNGFHAHLDRPVGSHAAYGVKDILALDAFAEDVSTTGFKIPVLDKSTGGVELQYIAGTWMACQFPGTSSEYDD